MKEDLIKDGNRIRKCPSNIAKMSYFSILKEFNYYKLVVNRIINNFEKVIECFLFIISYILMIILFPILPLIICYNDKKQAIKEVEAEKRRKNETKDYKL
jgi:hypothetical protein